MAGQERERRLPRLTDAGMVSPPGKTRYSVTTGYIPPEGSGSKQADVYALTMVLYEMSTGLDRLEIPCPPAAASARPCNRGGAWNHCATPISFCRLAA